MADAVQDRERACHFAKGISTGHFKATLVPVGTSLTPKTGWVIPSKVKRRSSLKERVNGVGVFVAMH